MRKVRLLWPPSKPVEGYFHGFFSGYDEFDTGPGNYTVAIVEDMEGKIYEAMPKYVLFLDKPEETDGTIPHH